MAHNTTRTGDETEGIPFFRDSPAGDKCTEIRPGAGHVQRPARNPPDPRGLKTMGERYGKILRNGSSVVYSTDNESLGAGWKFTTTTLSETV
jgi:hypothetical protein